MKIKTLVIIPLNEQQQEKICQFQNNLDFDFCYDNNVKIHQISDAEIIIGNPPVHLLSYAKKLKWLQLITAGADLYLKQGILNKNVILTNASGAYGEAQSEFMLALLLALYKKLHNYRDNQLQGFWNDEGNEKMLSGSTAVVIGMGDIGTQYAKKLKALGVYVIGVRRSNNKSSEYADEIYSYKVMNRIIHRADIVSMVLPSTPETVNLMNRDMLSQIKPGAVLINVGRGNTLDTDALCDALENKIISGAALDVFENEPLNSDHKLWSMKNVIITPHVAGHDFLQHTLNKTIMIILKNIKAYLEDENLVNTVNRSVYEFKN